MDSLNIVSILLVLLILILVFKYKRCIKFNPATMHPASIQV